MSAWETQQRNEPTGMVLRGFAVSGGRMSAPIPSQAKPLTFFLEPS
jgi:hypothetical protein